MWRNEAGAPRAARPPRAAAKGKAKQRAFDVFDEAEPMAAAALPSSAAQQTWQRTAQQTAQLVTATRQALQAAHIALAPTDPLSWRIFADTCRHVCLRCVVRDGRLGSDGAQVEAAPPDWNSYRTLMSELLPTNQLTNQLTNPPLPTRQVEAPIVPPPIAAARRDLQAFLRLSACAPLGSAAPPPPFDTERLDAASLLRGLSTIGRGHSAAAERAADEAMKLQAAAEAKGKERSAARLKQLLKRPAEPSAGQLSSADQLSSKAKDTKMARRKGMGA